LASEAGTLVSKDRFMDEVWRGIPVTDEALTQCIKSLRRVLGDDAARPRFIETVPKHGYRFIAPVEPVEPAIGATNTLEAKPGRWRDVLLLGAAGTVGGGVAAFFGGLVYGFAGASQPLQPGLGAISILLVVLCLTIIVGLIGGLGVSFGITVATAGSRRDWTWSVAGGAIGGMLIGATVKLLGVDAFNLLFGRSPVGITGALEGAIIGAAVGLGAWLAGRTRKKRRGITYAALSGGVAGAIIPAVGGRLMGGSLDLLSQTFPGSRLRLDQLGMLVGEHRFGPISQVVTGALEGALFSAFVVGALLFAQRSLNPVSRADEQV
jgi:DNA-binding winged helix-turn-helix (wHTH) protein